MRERTRRWGRRQAAVAAAVAGAGGLVAAGGATAAQVPAGDLVAFTAGTVRGHKLEIRAARVQESSALTLQTPVT